MAKSPSSEVIESYFLAIQALQGHVLKSQSEKLIQAASRMADTIQSKKRILIFGSGHSHIMAEEAFYRAGGLAPATPIFSPMLMLHEDPYLSSRLERSSGVAAILLERYHPNPGEMIFIFSNSGVNYLPVELGVLAHQFGLYVVSVSALAYAQTAALSELGVRLDEVADLAIDNGGIPGDALLQLEGCDWRVGPSSTILGALIWNSLVVECVACLLARGWQSSELPVIASLNMPGAPEHNEDVLAQWRQINLHL